MDEIDKDWSVKTEFIYNNVKIEIIDFFEERLYKYKEGNEVSVYLNEKNPAKSTINGEFRYDDFFAKIIPDIIIISLIVIARLFW